MKRVKYLTASKMHTFIAVLGIIVLAFLVLISTVGAKQPEMLPTSAEII
jgi:hypothetical protein